MIKIAKISFLFTLSLILIISCPNKPPIENNNKIEETRDDNGHLKKIEYFNNGTLYKTEYYEYLNKHDEESRLIKTVENEEITYEMEECWKIAFALQNNTYKYAGQMGQIYPNRRTSFGKIENSQIIVNTSHAGTGIYDIKSQTYTMDFDKNVQITIKFYTFNINQFSTGSGNDGNERVYQLIINQ